MEPSRARASNVLGLCAAVDPALDLQQFSRARLAPSSDRVSLQTKGRTVSSSNDTAETAPDLKIISTDEPASTEAQAPEAAADAAFEQAAPDAPHEAPQTNAQEAPPEPSRLPWLLGVALVFAIVFALWQGQRADRLASAVGVLEAQLATAGAELSAHKAHLSRVRVGLDDLTSRTQALSDLAHAEPANSSAASPSEPAASTSAASPTEPAASTPGASPAELGASPEPSGDGYTSPSESGIVDF